MRKIAKTNVPGKKASKLEFVLEGGVISMGYHSRLVMHYGGLDCWAKSASTGYAHIECNKHIAQ